MILTPEQLDQFYAHCCPWMDGDLKSAQDRFRFMSLNIFLVSVCGYHEISSVFPYTAILRASEEGSPVDLYDTADAAMSAAKAVDFDMGNAEIRPSDDSVFFMIEEHGSVRFSAWFAHLMKSLVYRLSRHASSKVEHGGLAEGLTFSEEEYRDLLEEMRVDRQS